MFTRRRFRKKSSSDPSVLDRFVATGSGSGSGSGAGSCGSGRDNGEESVFSSPMAMHATGKKSKSTTMSTSTSTSTNMMTSPPIPSPSVPSVLQPSRFPTTMDGVGANDGSGNADSEFNDDKGSGHAGFGGANPLAPFDACVEACDALAAGGGADGTSTFSGAGVGVGVGVGEGAAAGAALDIPDCSVSVSPDGTLLLVPSDGGGDGNGDGNGNGNGDGNGNGNGNGSAAADASVFFPGEDHESSIRIGTDLRPGSDRSANGFSLMGCASGAVTLALRRAEWSLRQTADYVEECAIGAKDRAASELSASERWAARALGPALDAWGVGGGGGGVRAEGGVDADAGWYGSGWGKIASPAPAAAAQPTSRAGKLRSFGRNWSSSSQSQQRQPSGRDLPRRSASDASTTTTSSSYPPSPRCSPRSSPATKHVRPLLDLDERAAAAAAAAAKAAGRSASPSSDAAALPLPLSHPPLSSSSSASAAPACRHQHQQSLLAYGPLSFPGTTLRDASDALERYHCDAAEADARRWKLASSASSLPSSSTSTSLSPTSIADKKDDRAASSFSSGANSAAIRCIETAGMLPDVRKSTSDAARRMRDRESALARLERRADASERRLLDRRAESARLWDAVRRAEARADVMVEEAMLERSRARERERRLEQNARQAAAAEGTLQTGVTQAELWELVSRLGDELEGSSFSPIGLPDPSVSGPRDASFRGRKFENGRGGERGDEEGYDDESGNGDVNNTDDEHGNGKSGMPADRSMSDGVLDTFTQTSTQYRPHVAGMVRPASPPLVLPPADRDHIEESLNLPLLRAQALSSDDDVEDAAYALLNALNALDLTRRSARVAAEGALLSAANAQLRCLKALVRLERDGLDDRSRRLAEVEKVLDAVDVRSDLDAFVQAEKRDRPGAVTAMGDDDDGGIASALAVLNSHGEQQDGTVGEGRMGWGGVGFGEKRIGGGIVSATAAAGMFTYEGWADGEDDGGGVSSGWDGPSEDLDLTRDEIEDVVALIFDGDDPLLLSSSEWEARAAAAAAAVSPSSGRRRLDGGEGRSDGLNGTSCTSLPSLSSSSTSSFTPPAQPGTEADRADAIRSFRSPVRRLSLSLTERGTRGRIRRSNVCYALNARRSFRTELDGRVRFDALCEVFDALLTGCDREAADVASAKMCMMLAVTFYVTDPTAAAAMRMKKRKATKSLSSSVGDVVGERGDDGSDDVDGTDWDGRDTKNGRNERIYVKDELLEHPIWSDEDFWVQALFQCVSESLTQSGVMSNFDRPYSNGVDDPTAGPPTRAAPQSSSSSSCHRHNRHDRSHPPCRRVRWYDLTPDERCAAASQVHAVIFAQLSALAHSMMEFGCGVRKACAFVRTLSVRHQLPLAQRTVLLQHLMRNCGGDDDDDNDNEHDGGEEEEEEGQNEEEKKEQVKGMGDGVASGGVGNNTAELE